MKLCQVVGTVVGAAHHEAYDGQKLMIVQPQTPEGKALGDSYLAVDQVQSGPGDKVLVLTEGTGVRQLLGESAGPIRSVVVAIVDDVLIGTGDRKSS